MSFSFDSFLFSFLGDNNTLCIDLFFVKNSKFLIFLAKGLKLGLGSKRTLIALLASNDIYSGKSILPFKTLSSMIFYFNLRSFIPLGGVKGGIPQSISYIRTPIVQTSNFSL